MSTTILQEIRHWLEPVAASVYFTPEPNKEYADLGLNVMEGYFCSRSAAMGKAPGAVVSSVFGFFRPELASAATEAGWEKTTPDILIEARERGATAALTRLLDDPVQPRVIEILRPAVLDAPAEGRPLYAAWREVDWPTDPTAELFRVLDLFREHRGAGHLDAWACTGLSPLEASMITEAWLGMPPGTYARTFGWGDEDFQRGTELLTAKGLFEEAVLSETGRKLRVEIETLTDRSQSAIEAALGDDGEELAALLKPLAEQVLAGGGYPMRTLHPDDR